MGHPHGGHGNFFRMVHTFDQASAVVRRGDFEFISTTGETIVARRGRARDGITPTIVFQGENCVHGNVCHAC